MKKFFLRLILLLLPFCIINWLYMYAEYIKTNDNLSRFFDVPSQIQVGNSGSSLGGAFDYSVCPELTTFNFAIPNQFINYDYQILQQYLDNFAEDSVYFIVLSYTEIDGIQSSLQFEKIEKRYYFFMKPKYLIDCNFWKYIKLKFFPLSASSQPFYKIYVLLIKNKIQKFKEKIKNIKPQPKQEIAQIAQTNQIVQSESISQTAQIEELKAAFEARTSKENFLSMLYSAAPRKGEEGFYYNKEYLLKFIRLCNEHKIYPVVVTCPVPAISNKYIAEDGNLFEVYKELKSEVLQTSKVAGLNCEWLDYSHSENYTNNYEYFGDFLHMNNFGSKVFTADIISEVRKRGILKY